jgi:hypothetical protein
VDSRIPTILQPLFQEFTNRIDQEMPGRISAFYLEGSIALDGFNPRLSDVDFVAVLNSQVTTCEVKKIRSLHESMEHKYPQWKLSGRYFQHSDLGCLNEAIQPHLNYHDGKLMWSSRFNLSEITWWILKNHGIAVFGPPPQSLNYTVDMDNLVQNQLENMNTYWASYTTRLDGLLALLTDWGIQWTVLGVLRQYYTIHERQIICKIKAGESALVSYPDRWHRIIQEAIALRENPRRSLYRSRIKRAENAHRFLKYTIRTCNDYLDSRKA